MDHHHHEVHFNESDVDPSSRAVPKAVMTQGHSESSVGAANIEGDVDPSNCVQSLSKMEVYAKFLVAKYRQDGHEFHEDDVDPSNRTRKSQCESKFQSASFHESDVDPSNRH